jgi:hypothetical protein
MSDIILDAIVSADGIVDQRRNLRAIPLHSAHCAYPSLGLSDGTANQAAKISVPMLRIRERRPPRRSFVIL